MRNFICILFVLLISCSDYSGSACDINPPTWIQGSWEFDNGDVIEFTNDDISFKTFGIEGLCNKITGELASGVHSFFDEVEVSDKVYAYRYLSSNRPPRPIQSWIYIDENIIGMCEESVPCSSWEILIRKN
jgi:hypothetical protein